MGIAPSVRASGPQVRSSGSVAWVRSDGTVWHSVQAIGPLIAPPRRWRWCEPTPGEVVDVLPEASVGGAAAMEAGWRFSSPWQEVQLPEPESSTDPFR